MKPDQRPYNAERKPMLCPKCGWELRELKLKAQYCRDAFTCDNGVCEYCNVVFTLHLRIVGVLVMSGEDEKFEERKETPCCSPLK
jgi:hypothetical protein